MECVFSFVHVIVKICIALCSLSYSILKTELHTAVSTTDAFREAKCRPGGYPHPALHIIASKGLILTVQNAVQLIYVPHI